MAKRSPSGTAVKREELLEALISVSPGLSLNAEFEQSHCFTADTIIHTLEGDFTVAELLEQGKEEFLVYSTDGNKITIGEAFGLRRTKKNAKVYEVRFDYDGLKFRRKKGEGSIKLTGDHLVMLRDGTYRKVEDLKEGDSLMPFNHEWKNDRRFIYEHISHGRVPAYRWVFQQVHGRKVQLPNHIHHVDHNPKNDHPDNLVEVTNAEHARIGCEHDHPSRKPESRRKRSENMRGNSRGAGVPKPGTAVAMLGNKNAEGGRGNTKPRTKKQLESLKAGRAALERKRLHNHKVLSIKYVGREDVYDLSVNEYHNFAANGIFIHNCFVFKDDMIRTYNDEISCVRESPVKGLHGAVHAKPLLELLQKMTEDDIRVEIKDDKFIVKGKAKTGKIACYDTIVLEYGEAGIPDEWHDLDSDWLEGVEMVAACASHDQSDYVYTTVRLTPDFVEAMDSWQAGRFTVKSPVEDQVFIRRQAVKFIVDMGMEQISLSEQWAHFKSPDGLQLSCRISRHEEYPEMGDMFNVKGKKIAMPKGLAEAAQRAEIMCEDEDKYVTVNLSENKLTISSVSAEGMYEESRKVKYNGKDLIFDISAPLLAKMCEKYEAVRVGDTRMGVKVGLFRYVTVLKVE